MDPCLYILRESSSRWNELHDDVLVLVSGNVAFPMGLSGILGIHVDDQINGEGDVR